MMNVKNLISAVVVVTLTFAVGAVHPTSVAREHFVDFVPGEHALDPARLRFGGDAGTRHGVVSPA